MDETAKLTALLDVLEDVGVAVRRMPNGGDGPEHGGGAVVRVKGKEILFLDPLASLPDQISAVAEALRGRKELAERFLPPELREIIDDAGRQSR